MYHSLLNMSQWPPDHMFLVTTQYCLVNSCQLQVNQVAGRKYFCSITAQHSRSTRRKRNFCFVDEFLREKVNKILAMFQYLCAIYFVFKFKFITTIN